MIRSIAEATGVFEILPLDVTELTSPIGGIAEDVALAFPTQRCL